MRTVLMTTVPTHPAGTGSTVPTHPAGHQAPLIAWMKEHQGLRSISTDTIWVQGVQGFKQGLLRIDTPTTPQNCHPNPLVNGLSHLSAIALPPPHHLTETWAKVIEALVLTALPHGNFNTAGQAVPHHVVLRLPPRLLITPLMAVAVAVILLVMSVVDTVLPRHIQGKFSFSLTWK